MEYSDINKFAKSNDKIIIFDKDIYIKDEKKIDYFIENIFNCNFKSKNFFWS